MAKATTSPTSAAAASAVTLRQMAAELAERHDLPRRQAEALMNDMVALATRHLKRGHRLRLTGLGTSGAGLLAPLLAVRGRRLG